MPEAPPAKVEPTGLAAQQTVEGFQAVAASRAPAAQRDAEEMRALAVQQNEEVLRAVAAFQKLAVQ